MKKIVITGSQSGMGLAARLLLEKSGYKVIGVDLPGKGAEVEGDLSIREQRLLVVNSILDLCDGNLDGIIANAGVDSSDVRLVFELNYFDVIEILEGLNKVLSVSRNARVLITASNSIFITPQIPPTPVQLLLDNQLDSAIASIGDATHMAYQVSKLAVINTSLHTQSIQKCRF